MYGAFVLLEEAQKRAFQSASPDLDRRCTANSFCVFFLVFFGPARDPGFATPAAHPYSREQVPRRPPVVLVPHATYACRCLITRCSNNYWTYQYPKPDPLFAPTRSRTRRLPSTSAANLRDWTHVVYHVDASAVLSRRGCRGRPSHGVPGTSSTCLHQSAILARTRIPRLSSATYEDAAGHDRRTRLDSSELTCAPYGTLDPGRTGIAQTTDFGTTAASLVVPSRRASSAPY